MSGLKQKKKSLKERQNTLQKDSEVTLHCLIKATEEYLRMLEEDPFHMPSNCGSIFKFKRFEA